MLSLVALVYAADTGTISGTVTAEVSKNRANAVVYVKVGDKGPATTTTVRMDQAGLVFSPHVLPVQQGWTVDFHNSDSVGHNVFTTDGETYDLGTWPKGDKRSRTFSKTGVYRQLCKVHDDMIAYVVVLDTGRFATSDKDGHFTLSGLPAGQYTLGTWHEKLGATDTVVTVTAGATTQATIALTAR